MDDSTHVMDGGDAIVVLITTASREEADRIARQLVEERVAACVTIVPQVRSLFIWEQKVSQEDEVLLVVKSRRPRFAQLAAVVTRLHSYRAPEIIALPVAMGSGDYLRWLSASTP